MNSSSSRRKVSCILRISQLSFLTKADILLENVRTARIFIFSPIYSHCSSFDLILRLFRVTKRMPPENELNAWRKNGKNDGRK